MPKAKNLQILYENLQVLCEIYVEFLLWTNQIAIFVTTMCDLKYIVYVIMRIIHIMSDLLPKQERAPATSTD